MWYTTRPIENKKNRRQDQRRRKIMKRTTTKKKGEFIYVNREVTKFQRRLAILSYFKTVHLKQYIYVTHRSLN